MMPRCHHCIGLTASVVRSVIRIVGVWNRVGQRAAQFVGTKCAPAKLRARSSVQMDAPQLACDPDAMINDLWYKSGVIYCLSVGTFMDANADGIGDFQGLMRRLDYLHGLGITAIWLMPFQTSPCRDDGYDISDYYGVDPRYGTLGDFVEFTHGAQQRCMRVIIDLVVNHTSDKHAWFKHARSDPKSKHRDWYVWADKRQANATPAWCFPACR